MTPSQRRTGLRHIWLMIFAVAIFGADTAAAAPVLLISVDGMRPDYVTHAQEHQLKIPTLRRFMTEGSWADGVIGVTPTVTYPSHTTLVTGATPAEHGIYANTPFDPLLENDEGWYWYAQDIKVETLWQAADRAGLITASVEWPVTVAAPGIRYNLPEFGTHTTDNMKTVEALARPDGLLTDLESRLGAYTRDGTEEGDRVRVKFALEILRRYKPAFMTVHLLAVDHRSHEHGPFSEEANAALEVLDGLISQLLEAAIANDPNTIVAVVSDHGFAPIQHVFSLKIPFVQAGLIKLSEPLESRTALAIEDWRAEVWNAGGSAAIMLKDPTDAQLRAQVEALLHKLRSDPGNGIARILGPGEVKETGGWPGASFIVDMQPGYYIGGRFLGPVTGDLPRYGQHGYLPEHPEMRAAFLILGRSIAKGRDVGTIDMRQVAPTLAKLLGVKLTDATLPAVEVTATPAH